jgi:hypothetical protein
MAFTSDKQRKAFFAKGYVKVPRMHKPKSIGSKLRGTSLGYNNFSEDERGDARELSLTIDNDEPMYRRIELMNKNLAKKKYAGKYDRDKAVKLFEYATDAAAKYHKQHYPEAMEYTFSKGSRVLAAMEYRDDFESRFNQGDFIDFKQKKFGGKGL